MPLTLSIQPAERYALASGFCRVCVVLETPEGSADGSTNCQNDIERAARQAIEITRCCQIGSHAVGTANSEHARKYRKILCV